MVFFLILGYNSGIIQEAVGSQIGEERLGQLMERKKMRVRLLFCRKKGVFEDFLVGK